MTKHRVYLAAVMFIIGCSGQTFGQALSPAELGKARLTSSCGPDILQDPLGLRPSPTCTHLVFAGVAANFPRIAVWLLEDYYETVPNGTFRGDVLFIGTRSGDGAKQVGEGLAHLSVIAPAPLGYMAYHGTGMFPKAYPNLRGLFRVGKRDPFTLAARADAGVGSLEEVIQKKIPLKITLGLPDPERILTFFFSELLKAEGTSLAEFESWGGRVIPTDKQGTGGIYEKLEAGEVNALCTEGMLPVSDAWKRLNQRIPMRLLTIREDMIEKLGRYGFRKYDQPIRKGQYPGALGDVNAVDTSDWIVIASSSVPEAIAYKLTQIGVEQKRHWESQYPEMAPIGSKEMGLYSIEPQEMWKNLGVPLHAGAERYFKEKNLMH